MGLVVLHQLLLGRWRKRKGHPPPQHSLDGTGTEAAGICRRWTHQEALELLGLGDVDPAVFLDHLDVFNFIVESGSVK